LVSQIVDARKVTSEAMMEAMGINTTAMVAVSSRVLLAVLVHGILIPRYKPDIRLVCWAVFS
jgi:hypothetical protein